MAERAGDWVHALDLTETPETLVVEAEVPAVHGRRGPALLGPPAMPTRYAPGMRGEERR